MRSRAEVASAARVARRSRGARRRVWRAKLGLRADLDAGAEAAATIRSGTMIKEIVHFLRKGPEVTRLQRQYARAEFVDALSARVDAQGYAEVRRELVGDLSGRVLEIGCGTGTMFEYYGTGVELDAIEPEPDFLALAVTKAGTVRASAR